MKDSNNDSLMPGLQDRFDRMAEWQRGRKSLSWPEKIRMVEAIRESIEQFRRAQKAPTAGNTGSEESAEGKRIAEE